MYELTRGIRNNNPLNLRRSGDLWRGLSPTQKDPDFAQFTTMTWGIRAAFVNVRTHLTRDKKAHRPTTVSSEISRWAPPKENDTRAYVEAVCKKGALKADEPLDWRNKNQLCRLLWAMAHHENGQTLSFQLFETAYELAQHLGD